jgi:hypothetical protein
VRANDSILKEIAMKFRFFVLVALGAALSAPSLTWACSSCGCFLNSDWASQGYAVASGLRFDMRDDYFNQDQLRTGTGTFDRGSAQFPNDREIQQSTLNRNVSLGFDYSPSRIWGVNLLLPVFDRPHTTVAEGDEEISRSRSRGIGDVRVLGRYQGFEGDASLGVQFGLKVPTGRINYRFAEGPQSGGPLDRGLQPGTGTTDLLLGVYHFGALSEELGYFANALAQVPLNSRDQFRPGAGLTVNVGMRYQTASGIEPQLQINARTERRESGANADVDNSGATLVNLSPGVAVPINKQLQAYAFVQLPIYQRVNGLQLEPRYTVSIGLRWNL